MTQTLLGWVLGCTFVYAALFGAGSLLYGRMLQVGGLARRARRDSGIGMAARAPRGLGRRRRRRGRLGGLTVRPLDDAGGHPRARARHAHRREASRDRALAPSRRRRADRRQGDDAARRAPFLDYVLSALADAGITDVVLVIGPEHHQLREYFSAGAPPERVRVRFAMHRSRAAPPTPCSPRAASVDDAPFSCSTRTTTILSGRSAARRRSSTHRGWSVRGRDPRAQGGIEPERVLKYALVDATDDGWLRAIREKPAADDPLARRAERWVSMNVWSFTPMIFDGCERMRPSARGELEIQEAVTIAMRDLGERFRVLPMRGRRARSLESRRRRARRRAAGGGRAAAVSERGTRTYVVPGRVELVGKHVDYAGGRSITCAVDRAITATVTEIDEPVIRVRDEGKRGFIEVPLAAGVSARTAGKRRGTYVVAVARRFARDSRAPAPASTSRLRSTLPPSAGLSSSSALVVALGSALAGGESDGDDDAWSAIVGDPLARAEYFGAMETGRALRPVRRR